MARTDWTQVESSNVDAVCYDAQQSQLFVRFKTGSVYMYDKVPVDEHENLLSASSPGGYLRENIIGTYAAQRV